MYPSPSLSACVFCLSLRITPSSRRSRSQVRVCLTPSASQPAAAASVRSTAALALLALAALALSSTLLLQAARTLPHALEG
eukprot:6050209-Pleurochrysis_carterae.AAC.1